MMAYDSGLNDEDDFEGLEDAPAPINTIAGPQTTRDQVMQRIAGVRNPTASDTGGEAQIADDPNRAAAMQFAKSTALTSGLGRALNTLSAGTGFKPDDSAYDALDKQPQIAMKDLDRSALVRKAVEDRKLKQSIADQTAGIRKDDNARKDLQTKEYGRRTDVMGTVSGNKQDTATIRAANTILNDKNAQTEVKKLQSSRSAQSLVDAIRSGDLTDSKNVAKQLTNMIATIELGTPGGQGDRQAMGVDTLYGKMKGALGYVEGKPEGVIPAEYLDQLESEVHALGDRAAANYKNLTDATLSGADLSGGNQDADTGKVYTLAKQRRDSLMRSNGYDPENGQAVGRAKQSKSAAPKAGDLVKVKGVPYRVGADGDSLEPIS